MSEQSKALPQADNPSPPWMTPDQLQGALAWLNEHWTQKDCPFHGPTKWQIGEFLSGAPPFIPSGGKPLDKAYPLVVVTCLTCGYTVFVNSIVAGVVEGEKDAPEPPETPA